MIETYLWRGGAEALLRFGPAGAAPLILLLPLFEEHNRTRAFGAAVLRALAARGIAGVLPELPGQGESPVPTEALRLADLRAAVCNLVQATGARASFAIRSGALLDTEAALATRLQFAPQSGAALVRELRRVQAQSPGADIAGNLLSEAQLADFATALPAPAHVLRLASDPAPAARHLPGAPPWRRAEPESDPALAAAVAAAIAERLCAG